MKARNQNRREGVSPVAPGVKTESRVRETSRVGEEHVSTYGPSGQVKLRIQGLRKMTAVELG